MRRLTKMLEKYLFIFTFCVLYGVVFVSLPLARAIHPDVRMIAASGSDSWPLFSAVLDGALIVYHRQRPSGYGRRVAVSYEEFATASAGHVVWQNLSSADLAREGAVVLFNYSMLGTLSTNYMVMPITLLDRAYEEAFRPTITRIVDRPVNVPLGWVGSE